MDPTAVAGELAGMATDELPGARSRLVEKRDSFFLRRVKSVSFKNIPARIWYCCSNRVAGNGAPNSPKYVDQSKSKR